jgi:predicted permease
MLIDSLLLMLPIIILAAGGYFLARRLSISEEVLVQIIIDFLMPMLVFYALYDGDVLALEAAKLAGSVTFIVGALLGITFLYSRLTKFDFKSLTPPVIFMNSGFLGIPLMSLWGGAKAMGYIVVYDQIQTIYIFSVGIFIVTGGFTLKGLKETVKSPILWAIALGFLFKGLQIPVPPSIIRTLQFGGDAAPPLAAFALGVALYGSKLHISRHLFFGIAARVVLGFLIALASVFLFNIQGTARTVVLVASSLPSAVFSSMLPLRYGVKADYAGTMVVVTTILGVFTIPLSFTLASLI